MKVSIRVAELVEALDAVVCHVDREAHVDQAAPRDLLVDEVVFDDQHAVDLWRWHGRKQAHVADGCCGRRRRG